MDDAQRGESSSHGCSDQRNLLQLVGGKGAPEAANERMEEDGENELQGGEQAEEGGEESKEEDEEWGPC